DHLRRLLPDGPVARAHHDRDEGRAPPRGCDAQVPPGERGEGAQAEGVSALRTSGVRRAVVETAMTVEHLNPEGLPRNPAFSQGVVVDTPSTTIYVGGQNGVDADGKVVGDDLASQTRRALENVGTVLRAGGASLADVVHWRIVVVDGQSLQDGFAA